MGKIVIGVGEAAASGNPEDEIKTFALGSCVAVMFLDTKARVGGMVHVALPESETDRDKSKTLPGYFADTGIPYLLELMRAKGSVSHAGYIVKIAGGANVMNSTDHFKIGQRNVTAIKKILWELNLPIKAEDVGADYSRTVSLEMQKGRITISSSDGSKWSL